MRSSAISDIVKSDRSTGAETPRVVLVRHAQASLGTSDYDRLSPLGHDQARFLARRLVRDYPASGLVRGEHRRHRETAAPLARALPAPSVDPDLNEYKVDALLRAAAARAEQLALSFPGPEAEANPVDYLDVFLRLFPKVLAAWQRAAIDCEVNGTWAEFRSRVDAAAVRLDALARRRGTVLAITSAGVISTMAAGLMRRDLSWQRELNVALYNSAVTELRLDVRGRWVASSLNCVEHLPDPSLHSLA